MNILVEFNSVLNSLLGLLTPDQQFALAWFVGPCILNGIIYTWIGIKTGRNIRAFRKTL